MSIAAAKGMTAMLAVATARKYFDQFFADQVIENVLLEELDYDEGSGHWLVTIGFDVGRKAIRQPNQNALAVFSQQVVTPIREARLFEIVDADGSLDQMRNV